MRERVQRARVRISGRCDGKRVWLGGHAGPYQDQGSPPTAAANEPVSTYTTGRKLLRWGDHGMTAAVVALSATNTMFPRPQAPSCIILHVECLCQVRRWNACSKRGLRSSSDNGKPRAGSAHVKHSLAAMACYSGMRNARHTGSHWRLGQRQRLTDPLT